MSNTLAEIKSVYRQRCMEYHPNVNLVENNIMIEKKFYQKIQSKKMNR